MFFTSLQTLIHTKLETPKPKEHNRLGRSFTRKNCKYRQVMKTGTKSFQYILYCYTVTRFSTFSR